MIKERKNKLKSFYDKIKYHSTKIWKWLDKHNGALNALATIALIIVSISLYNATTESTNIAKRLGQIEMNIKIDNDKLDVLKKISLAENLLIEIRGNKIQIKLLRDKLLNWLNETDILTSYLSTVPDDLLHTARMIQAKGEITFGDSRLVLKLDDYLDLINKFKDHIEEIRRATRNKDYKIKRERINSIINLANQSIEKRYKSINIDEFIKDVEDYLKLQEEEYKKLDNLSKIGLKQLFKD